METEPVMAEKPANIEAVCRLCLSQEINSLKMIFDEALSPNRLPYKIHQLIQIQVGKNDKLSTMVCNNCIIRLDTWFSWKKQCHRNQATLAEWHRSTGQNIYNMDIHIKSEPVDFEPPRHIAVPIKQEYPYYGDTMDEEFSDLPETPISYPQNTDRVYYEDLQKEMEEAEAHSVKCPECGKLFGSVQNRRRHQNMVHRRDRRAQMAEIRKAEPETPSQSHSQPDSESENTEQTATTIVETADSTSTVQNTSQSDDSSHTDKNIDNPEGDVSLPDADNAPEEKTIAEEPKQVSDSNTSEEVNQENDTQKESNVEDTEKTPVAENFQDSDENAEKLKENNDKSDESLVASQHKDTELKPSDEVDRKDNELQLKMDNDPQKIEFAAGLKLLQKDTTPIGFESLTKIELSYIEKCKAMVSMFHTLLCACHNVQHKSLRHLLSHLREIRVWFPLFTCYSCMISFTDRSTFTRHHCRCPKGQLETLIKLSNLRKRSEIKTRLYQNYKCNRCKFLYSFHQDFCNHIDEDHSAGLPPIYCSCRTVFDSVEEYKTHCYTSCVLSYYCDICFITTPTIEEFVTHAEEIHDTSEGFVLLQDDSYTPRNGNYIRNREVDEEANVVEGKRERKKSAKEPILIQIYDREIPPEPKEIPTRVLRQMLQLEQTPTNSFEWNRKPTKCPYCSKEYSNMNNMIRHYRTHIERKEIELASRSDQSDDSNEVRYSCPECRGMYDPASWKKHIEENHPPISCSECDKEFQFQTELDQHRSVHLNLKVYRDSKTHSYKTAVISPGSETSEIVMVMCEICDAMFKSKDELKSHKLTHHDRSNMSRASSSIETIEFPGEDPLSMETDDLLEVKETTNSDVASEGGLPCDSCGKIYASAKSLREHVMNKHGLDFAKKSEFPKKCEYCDKVCASGAGLALHTQTHERYNRDKKSEFPKKCEYCDKICTTGAGLYLHTQMHEKMTLGDLKKDVKPELTKDKKKLIYEHQEEDESYHTCNRCFKVFGTRGKLKDHMKSHGINSSKPGPKLGFKKDRKLLCDLCHVAVENKEALDLHKIEEHGDELDGMPMLRNEMEEDEGKTPVVYTCDVCVETFDSKSELRTHKEEHQEPILVSKTKISTIYCKYCKIAFNSINELTKHMHVQHGESAKPKVTKEKPTADGSKQFKCSVCGKGFATHGAMTAHFGWHKRTANNAASEANTPHGTAEAKFVKKAKLLKKVVQAAANKQEPIKPPEFQCTTCFMELPNDTALEIHILEKHGNLDALMLVPRCDTCNQDFSTQAEYETHKRFHDFLNRQKRHEEQLQTQQHIQTPIIQSVQSVSESPQGTSKKFPCSWCNSVFSRSDTLNTHIKNNHKEHVKTEFECPHCDRVFEKQNSLSVHLKVHEKQKAVATATIVGNGVGSKVYSCSICSQGFSFPKDLRMHTINAHPF